MKIQVTQDHINAGKKEDCQKCPIALAIAEAIPNIHVSVFGKLSSVCNAPAEFRQAYIRLDGIGYRLPQEASDFIDDFDYSREVRPFEFKLGYSR
jgi:hypothetical protein